MLLQVRAQVAGQLLVLGTTFPVVDVATQQDHVDQVATLATRVLHDQVDCHTLDTPEGAADQQPKATDE